MITPNFISHRLITKSFRVILFGSLYCLGYGNNILAQTVSHNEKSERIVSFSGYDWLVRSSRSTSSGTTGPGNNYFSDSGKNVWVDKKGYLHLKITHRNKKWYCAEVILTRPFGYKKYVFHVLSRVDTFHPNVVGGLFTYLDGKDGTEEIDIEFSKWGKTNNVNNAVYVIQPSDRDENTKSFNFKLNGNASTYLFDWKPGTVDFGSYHGHYASVPSDSALIINKWTYYGRDIPVDLNGRIHINLWLFRRETIDPTDKIDAEMIIKSFQVF